MTLHAPLRPRIFHVLLALSHESQHGYGIKKSVRKRTGGSLDLDPGGLYRLISRLEDEGLLREAAVPQQASSKDRRRRYYELTEVGEEALRAEAKRLSQVAAWPDVQRLAKGAPR